MKLKFKPKDPGSAITHFIGMWMAVFAATPLIFKAARQPDLIHLISLSIFIISMILLYAASTIYHTLDISETVNRRLKKLDHMMILSYCRFLYPDLPDCTARNARMDSAFSNLGNCYCRNID